MPSFTLLQGSVPSARPVHHLRQRDMALGISGQAVVAVALGALERTRMEKHNLAQEGRSSQKRHLSLQ